jgi:LysR substrate binding domain
MLVKMDQKRRSSVPVKLAATVKAGDSFEATFDPEGGELTFRRINPQADWVELFELDLALTAGQSDRPTAHQVGELPLVWIAGPRFHRRSQESMPLVAFEAPCLLRERMLQVLDQAGIPWRIALVSPSLSGLWAGASAGLGVTARGDLGLPENLVAGARLFDLPELGSLPVHLHRRRNAKSEAIDRLAEIVNELAMRVIPRATGPKLKLTDVRSRPTSRSSSADRAEAFSANHSS